MSLFNTSYENEVRIRTKAHKTDELKILDKNTGEYVDIIPGGNVVELPSYVRPNEVNFADKIRIGPASDHVGTGVAINDQMISINAANSAINTAIGEGVVVSKGNDSITLEPGIINISDDGGNTEKLLINKGLVKIARKNPFSNCSLYYSGLSVLNNYAMQATVKANEISVSEGANGAKSSMTPDRITMAASSLTKTIINPDSIDLLNKKVVIDQDGIEIKKPVGDGGSLLSHDGLYVGDSLLDEESIEVAHDLKTISSRSSTNDKMVVYDTNLKEFAYSDIPSSSLPSYIKNDKIDFRENPNDKHGVVVGDTYIDISNELHIGGGIDGADITFRSPIDAYRLTNKGIYFWQEYTLMRNGLDFGNTNGEDMTRIFDREAAECTFDLRNISKTATSKRMIVYDNISKEFVGWELPGISQVSVYSSSNDEFKMGAGHDTIDTAPSNINTLPKIEIGGKLIIIIYSPKRSFADSDIFYGAYLHPDNYNSHLSVTCGVNDGAFGGCWVKSMKMDHSSKKLLMLKPMYDKDQVVPNKGFSIIVERLT